MHVGSNPTARTSQFQSPRSPYRGAGRLFCTRFVGSIIFFVGTRNMRFSSFRASSPIQSRYAAPSSPISPPLVPLSRAAASEDSIRSAVLRPYSVWRDAMPPPSSSRSPSRWAGRLGPRSHPRFPIRSIGFSPSSSPRFLSGGSGSPLLSAFLYGRRGGCVFFARMSVFLVDFVAACDTLTNRYTCGRGGTADTPDLGSGGEIRVGSNPTARTMETHSPPPQPVQVAAGRAFSMPPKLKYNLYCLGTDETDVPHLTHEIENIRKSGSTIWIAINRTVGDTR